MPEFRRVAAARTIYSGQVVDQHVLTSMYLHVQHLRCLLANSTRNSVAASILLAIDLVTLEDTGIR